MCGCICVCVYVCRNYIIKCWNSEKYNDSLWVFSLVYGYSGIDIWWMAHTYVWRKACTAMIYTSYLQLPQLVACRTWLHSHPCRHQSPQNCFEQADEAIQYYFNSDSLTHTNTHKNMHACICTHSHKPASQWQCKDQLNGKWLHREESYIPNDILLNGSFVLIQVGGVDISGAEMRNWKWRSPERWRIYNENVILCVVLLNLLSDIM